MFVSTSVRPQVEPSSFHSEKPSKYANESYDKIIPNVNRVMVDGHPIDTHVFEKFFDDIINDNYVSFEDSVDIFNDNHHNIEVEVPSKTPKGNNAFNK